MWANYPVDQQHVRVVCCLLGSKISSLSSLAWETHTFVNPMTQPVSATAQIR